MSQIGQIYRYTPKGQKPEPAVAYIYTLHDPRTDAVRYVGRTARPEERLRLHVVDLGCSSEQKRRWHRELQAAGVYPYLKVIDEVSFTEGAQAEKKWVKYFLEQGCDLLNTEKAIRAALKA